LPLVGLDGLGSLLLGSELDGLGSLPLDGAQRPRRLVARLGARLRWQLAAQHGACGLGSLPLRSALFSLGSMTLGTVLNGLDG
jgi:hypothetical protein